MLSLVFVHGGGSLCDVNGIIHFLLVPVLFPGQHLGFVQCNCPAEASCEPSHVTPVRDQHSKAIGRNIVRFTNYAPT